jgi:hypothetical protein
MDERATDRPRRDDGDFCHALLQIRAIGLRGLAQANTELQTADDEGDSEKWALWRGYRKAMLEVLAITDKLPLPAEEFPPQTGGGKSHPGGQSPPAQPA